MQDSDLNFNLDLINGKKDIIEISNPSHIDIQLFEHRDKIVPVTINHENIINLKFITIKKKDILLLYLSYEPKSFISLSFCDLVYDEH